MGKQSKEELEKQFWEKWKVKIFSLFKKKHKREDEEKTELESYINFIYDYTEIHGVRETARRLEEFGFKINPSTLSQIRQGNLDKLVKFDYVAELAEAISNLSAEEKDEKNK